MEDANYIVDSLKDIAEGKEEVNDVNKGIELAEPINEELKQACEVKEEVDIQVKQEITHNDNRDEVTNKEEVQMTTTTNVKIEGSAIEKVGIRLEQEDNLEENNNELLVYENYEQFLESIKAPEPRTPLTQQSNTQCPQHPSYNKNELKQKIKDKAIKLRKRNAAIKILDLQKRLLIRKCLERIKLVAKERERAGRVIVMGITEWYKHKKHQKLIKSFIHHCASLIQRWYRKYRNRKQKLIKANAGIFGTNRSKGDINNINERNIKSVDYKEVNNEDVKISNEFMIKPKNEHIINTYNKVYPKRDSYKQISNDERPIKPLKSNYIETAIPMDQSIQKDKKPDAQKKTYLKRKELYNPQPSIKQTKKQPISKIKTNMNKHIPYLNKKVEKNLEEIKVNARKIIYDMKSEIETFPGKLPPKHIPYCEEHPQIPDISLQSNKSKVNSKVQVKKDNNEKIMSVKELQKLFKECHKGLLYSNL